MSIRTSSNLELRDSDTRAGAFWAYAYDGIGNRTGVTKRSGSASESYTTNKLNQVTARTNPGVVHVSGYAPLAATVLVNDRPTIRDGEYYYGTVEVDNSSGPVVATVTVKVIEESADEMTLTETSYKTIVRKASETSSDITHDARGNLLSDSVYDYTWDLKNRLVAMQTGSGITDEDAKVRVEFEFDPLDRRTQKLVYSWDSVGEDWQLDETIKFVWDGWLLVAELDASDDLVRSYIWGMDKSGSMQGAGGIGGLLAVVDEVAGKTYWAASDHNGNVMNLVDSSDQSVVAAYEYSPYGEVLTVDGSFAADNPMRFSTKYFDKEVGLYYYGYRYYAPDTGRWLNRDPIAEDGGFNLYAFVGNQPVNLIDPFGLAGVGHHWVPQAVYNTLSSQLSNEALDIFKKGTSGPLSYDHGFDTWNNVTHKKYNEAMEDLLRKYARFRNPGTGKLTAQQASTFLEWISTGKVGNATFLAQNADNFETVFNWRKGFLRSLAIADVAAQLDPKLTKAELKAIAKSSVNGESVRLSSRASKTLSKMTTMGKAGTLVPLLTKAGSKVAVPLAVFSLATSAQKGWSGEGHEGEGAIGAGIEMGRDIMMADLVEGYAFPVVVNIADAVDGQFSEGGIQAGAQRHRSRYEAMSDPKYGKGK